MMQFNQDLLLQNNFIAILIMTHLLCGYELNKNIFGEN